MTSTSMSGPITAANAAPLSMPKVATATAIASSKLLEAAVKGEGGALPVASSDSPAEYERNSEHDDEVQKELDGDARNERAPSLFSFRRGGWSRNHRRRLRNGQLDDVRTLIPQCLPELR
jgi:hypothetical protein